MSGYGWGGGREEKITCVNVCSDALQMLSEVCWITCVCKSVDLYT